MKPIVIRLTKASGVYLKGAELGYASEAVARKHHGDAFTIVRHTDTSEYVPPKAEPKKAEPKTGDTN